MKYFFSFSLHATKTTLFSLPTRQYFILCAQAVIESAPIAIIISFFAGAVLMLQAYNALQSVGGGSASGYIVGLGGVRELFPLLALAAVTAKSGAKFAAEIASMKVTQQVEAIEVIGIDPFRLLIAPRLAACILATPIIVIFANSAGLLGAYIVSVLQLALDQGNMWTSLLTWLNLQDFFIGCMKGIVFGWLVGIFASLEGLKAYSGAKHIGLATNKTIVRSMIWGCLVGFSLTYLVYGSYV